MSHANLSIFVPHIGCPNRCSFCDQNRISGAGVVPNGETVRLLCQRALAEVRDRRQTEIAFFGGSFTAIDRSLMLELLEAACEFVGPDSFYGIRISTRPDAVDEEILGCLKNFGVTSIELGVQSMDDGVLAENRRGHTARDVRRSAQLIRAAGFELGLQMMTGLYGDTAAGSMETADQIAALKPDTVRVYPTVVLPGTELARLWERGEYHPVPLGETVELCADLLVFFREKNIRVIRMGLHASELVESSRLAGPYHPAFRELCEAGLYLRAVLRLIAEKGYSPGKWTVTVGTGQTSKMSGQRRANLIELEKKGYLCKIREAAEIPPFAVAMAPRPV